MERITVTGFDQLRKEITGECLKSELYWAENAECRIPIGNGVSATKYIPTSCYNQTWNIDGKQINLTKYIREYGEGVKQNKEYKKGVETVEYVIAGTADNDVLISLIDHSVELSQAASALGKLGGAAKTEAKANASRANGKLGGRPKKAIAQAEED